MAQELASVETIQLHEFIRFALVDIASGVREANAEIRERYSVNDNYFVLRSNRADPKRSTVEFDVAISASHSQKDRAGFMVALATVGAGARTDKGLSGEHAHRIKFEIALDQDFR